MAIWMPPEVRAIIERETDIPNDEAAAELERIRNREWARTQYAAESVVEEEIELFTLSQIRTRPRPRYWVDGVFAENTINLVAGPPGVGKSFLILDLALSVATGEICVLGKPARRGRVLYVAGEGAEGYPARAESWMKHNRVDVADEAFMMIEKGVNLSSARSVDKLSTIITERQFDFIVLDTFRKLTSVESENDAAQIATVFRAAQRIRESNPGACLVIVHHTNKSGAINGSEAFRSEPDTVWTVRGDAGGFAFSSRKEEDGKVKDGGVGTRYDGLRLTSVGASAVVERSDDASVPLVDPLVGLEVDTVHTKAGLVEHIERVCGVSRSTAERSIANLVATGRLVKESHGHYTIGQTLKPKTSREGFMREPAAV